MPPFVFHTPRATSLLTEASMVTRRLYGPRPQGNNVRRDTIWLNGVGVRQTRSSLRSCTSLTEYVVAGLGREPIVFSSILLLVHVSFRDRSRKRRCFSSGYRVHCPLTELFLNPESRISIERITVACPQQAHLGISS